MKLMYSILACASICVADTELYPGCVYVPNFDQPIPVVELGVAPLPPMPYGLPEPTPEERAERKAALEAKIGVQKAKPKTVDKPPLNEGLAVVLERREMRRHERKEVSRKAVDGKLVRQWSDGTETSDPIQHIVRRENVTDAARLAMARRHLETEVLRASNLGKDASASERASALNSVADAAGKDDGDLAVAMGLLVAGAAAGAAAKSTIKTGKKGEA